MALTGLLLVFSVRRVCLISCERIWMHSLEIVISNHTKCTVNTLLRRINLILILKVVTKHLWSPIWSFSQLNDAYSKIFILPPSLLLSQTGRKPPTCISPRTMTVILDTTISIPCRKSVHITAFMPPWNIKICAWNRRTSTCVTLLRVAQRNVLCCTWECFDMIHFRLVSTE